LARRAGAGGNNKTYSVNNKHSGKRISADDFDNNGTTAERRRLGRIVHDERGIASIEWNDAPEHHPRPVLELENGPARNQGSGRLRRGFELKLEVRQEDTFNPYDRKPDTFGARKPGSKRDLRKLSEWIKTMRAVEDRKKNGDF
jgi:hypothetical protein